MCITCNMRDDDRWSFRGYFGGWKNTLPRKHRGEGNPAPWLMVRSSRIGLQLSLQRSRGWFTSELYTDPYACAGFRVISFMWGVVIVAWRIKAPLELRLV